MKHLFLVLCLSLSPVFACDYVVNNVDRNTGVDTNYYTEYKTINGYIFQTPLIPLNEEVRFNLEKAKNLLPGSYTACLKGTRFDRLFYVYEIIINTNLFNVDV